MAPMHLRGNTRQHVHQGEGGALPIEINPQVCEAGCASTCICYVVSVKHPLCKP